MTIPPTSHRHFTVKNMTIPPTIPRERVIPQNGQLKIRLLVLHFLGNQTKQTHKENTRISQLTKKKKRSFLNRVLLHLSQLYLKEVGSKFLNKRTDFEVVGIVNIQISLGYFPVGPSRMISGKGFCQWVSNSVEWLCRELGS